ncbi:MAG: putative response regulator [Myxococcales bacterium]|nr:putative response regulator [Myxococcales bacterium]
MNLAGLFNALVINDDASQDACIRHALSDAGCLDIETASSEHALLGDPDPTPDLIVVDVPAVGSGVLQRLVARFREVPIVALCSASTMDVAFAAGVADCAVQPIRADELRSRLRKTLRFRNENVRRTHRERKMSDAIAALQQEKQDLERLVCVDPLTGVANRRHTFALLEAEWRRAARERLALGVVMIDLDCYHSYNEQYGHLGGDTCLQRVTEAMVTCLRRPSDFLGRYGGEEFIAVLPNTDAVGAKIVSERLRSSVEALAIPHAASMCSQVVTITAGFASLRVLGDLSVDRLVAAADAALLRAKAQGRNQVGGDAPLTRPSRVSGQMWQRFAPVFADPWFADRIPHFLDDVRDEVRGISHALHTGHLDHVRKAAQALKLSAVEFGFLEIGRHAAALEHGVDLGHHETLRHSAEELLQYVTHVQVVYRRPTRAPIGDYPLETPTGAL